MRHCRPPPFQLISRGFDPHTSGPWPRMEGALATSCVLWLVQERTPGPYGDDFAPPLRAAEHRHALNDPAPSPGSVTRSQPTVKVVRSAGRVFW